MQPIARLHASAPVSPLCCWTRTQGTAFHPPNVPRGAAWAGAGLALGTRVAEPSL